MKTPFWNLDREVLIPLDRQNEHPQKWQLLDDQEEPQMLLGILECVAQEGGKTLLHCGHTFDVTAILQARRDFLDHQAQVVAHTSGDPQTLKDYAVAAAHAYTNWFMKFVMYHGWSAYGLLPIAFLKDDPARTIFASSCLERIDAAFTADTDMDAASVSEMVRKRTQVACAFKNLMDLWHEWEQKRPDKVPGKLAACFEKDYGCCSGKFRTAQEALYEKGQRPLPVHRLMQLSAFEWRLLGTTWMSRLWERIETVLQNGGVHLIYRGQIIDACASVQAKEGFDGCLRRVQSVRTTPAETKPATVGLESSYAELVIAFGVQKGDIWPCLQMVEEKVLDHENGPDGWIYEGFMLGFGRRIRKRFGTADTIVDRFANIVAQRRFWYSAPPGNCLEANPCRRPPLD